MSKAMLRFAFVALATLLSTAQAYQMYQAQIPNGNKVPNPCPEGGIWAGVGHQGKAGGNARNPFGLDFKAAGFKWTADLCRKDSDGDGMSNGNELGDPDCVWTPGATPARTTAITHPGLCPLDSKTCINSWEVCPKVFSCPAMNDANVTIRNFTVNRNFTVPAKDTTYICQAFELNNTADAVHMIGSRPIIVNKNIMHHMIMFACTTRPSQAIFDNPQECFMGNTNCIEMINLWAYGLEGECFNSNAGFRIGGAGYRYGLLQLHWNNPTLQAGYTDGSGFSLYFTQNMRKYDLGISMYGEVNLVIPPKQPLVNFNHTCPSTCTKALHQETRYITMAAIHMHTYGIQGRISLWRNGTFVRDLSPLQVYDYNTPIAYNFDQPIEYLPGDEVKTECYFSSLRSNRSVFYGEGTSDEMCFAFLSYYPNNVAVPAALKLSQCVAASGINVCWLLSGIKPQVEQGCNITGMITGDIPRQVTVDMYINGCFSRTGCDPACRKYLNNTLWPSNACYDPKRARMMTEVLAVNGLFNSTFNVATTISATLYGQRFCEQEIKMLADMDRMAAMASVTGPSPTAGSAQTAGLTSEHQLIIIIVCSCLGFALLLAVLGLIASKVHVGGGGHGAAAQGEVGKAYNVYDNPIGASVEATKM